jgi:hypothetical protein
MSTRHINFSLGITDRYILKQREDQSKIIESIGNFKFNIVDAILDSPIDHELAIKFNSWLQHVNAILTRWELFSELYPNTKALRSICNIDDQFFHRVETLYLWRNLLFSLVTKINEVIMAY